MATADIVEAVRTAGGRRTGTLAGWHAADPGAAVLDALVARTGIDRTAKIDRRCGSAQQAVRFAAQAVMRVRGKRDGLRTMCEGGGIADVTILEAL